MTSPKKLPKTDPFLEREIQKYQHPIPSREYILLHLETEGKPLPFQAIAQRLELHDSEVLEALRRRLRAMERDGQLIRNRRNGYGPAKKMDLVRGRVIAHPQGYGFLVSDEGGTDVYLSEKQMRSLMHGDRALVNILGIDYKERREGALVEILERNVNEVVGRFNYRKTPPISLVKPDNPRLCHTILVHNPQHLKAKDGQIVVVKITEYPTIDNPPIGEIIEIIGDQRAPGMKMDIAIRTYELPHQWSVETTQELKHLPKTVSKKMLNTRQDLRLFPFVTIDGEDAQDFDDAVYCESRGKGWLLKVAIADVAHYVKPNTALDQDAQKRGTSVYFPNQVLPMLPEALSNHLCSLKPHVDRLALICELAIDFYGRTRRTNFYPAIIQSAARLTYDQVAQLLTGDPTTFPYPHLIPHLENLYQLYQLLLKRRRKRGAIEFETIETKILFDQHQKIAKIQPVIRNDAHRLIEEMMLAANVATAEWLNAHSIPTLYRTHQGPKSEKLSELQQFLNRLGLKLGGKDQPQPLHYAKLSEKIQTRPDVRMIQTRLLRSLQLATYQPDAQKGHFGLAYPTYTHFTSPIRRYPDLLVHRAIYHCLQNQPVEQFFYTQHDMEKLGEHCSMTERRADEATRDVLSWLKCEYMQNKIGQTFKGVIVGVTSFGLFVELEDVFIEGLVHVTSLHNDYYHFDPIGQQLQGENTGILYQLSDLVQVKVMRVNPEERKIDLELQTLNALPIQGSQRKKSRRR